MNWANENTEDLYSLVCRNPKFKTYTLRDKSNAGYSLFGEHRLEQWHNSLSQTDIVARNLLQEDIDYCQLALVLKADDTDINRMCSKTTDLFERLRNDKIFCDEFILSKRSYLNAYQLNKHCKNSFKHSDYLLSNRIDWDQLTVTCMAFRHQELNLEKENSVGDWDDNNDPFKHLDKSTEKGKDMSSIGKVEYRSSKFENRIFFDGEDITTLSSDRIIGLIIKVKAKIKFLKKTGIKSKAIEVYKANMKNDVKELSKVLDSSLSN